MRLLKNRYFIFFLAVAVCFAVLAINFGKMTIIDGAEALAQGDDKKTRTITLKGMRGKIMDRNGVVLAYDQESYNVRFAHDPNKTSANDRAKYTSVLAQTIEIIERNGGTTIDTLNIRKNDAGEFEFFWNDDDETIIQKRRDMWFTNMGISDKSTTAKDAYSLLRNAFQLPEEMDYETAVKILSIWQEVRYNTYRSYVPIYISNDVNMQTVAEIETRSNELTGIEINEGSVRIYPKSDLAAHAIGYLGRIVDNKQLQELKKKGYSEDDLIGMTGIEKTFESRLTGDTTERQGSRVVEVNNRGNVMRELEYKAPKSGNNVVLTIDSKLQKKLEEALAENIKEARAYQEQYYKDNEADILEKMQTQGRATPLRMAEMGAAVVMDVNNGEVLGMVSYPSFDLNLFTNGISVKDFRALSKDPGKPLYNKADSTGIPGSIFKVVVGIAALMEGKTTVDRRITDEGPFVEYEKNPQYAPKCWVRPNYSKHADQNIVDAIKHSCNFYFFKMADELGIDLIDKWVEIYGLTEKTNIQLTDEKQGQVGSQKALYDNTKEPAEQLTSKPYLVWQKVVENLMVFYEEYHGKAVAKPVAQKAADEILKLVNENEQIGAQIREVMQRVLDIPEAMSLQKLYDKNISDLLVELRWSPNETVVTGVGLGVTMVSPVAVARYISAVVNGGTVYDANLVKQVVDNEGNVIEAPKAAVRGKTGVPQKYIDLIKEGMHDVTSAEDGGTAGKYFNDWSDERKALIGSKTGTGGVSKYAIEDNAWYVSFLPYDKPEIVIVVYIPNGQSGGLATYTAKKVMEYYLDQKENPAPANLSKPDELTK